MGQVPSYLIIGSGRVAKHFHFYLEGLAFKVKSWSRKSNSLAELQNSFNSADRCLLLVSDSSLETVLNQFPYLRSHKTVHFSGASSIEGVSNVHPLMSFSEDLYAVDFYKTIPFAVFSKSSSDSTKLLDLLPGVPNPSFLIREEQKALYHALCVVSGNFTTLLWQMTLRTFSNELSVSHQMLWPYLTAIARNIQSHPMEALTGPLARKDINTIKKNIASLKSNELKDIYLSFLNAHDDQLAQQIRSELTENL